MTKARAPKRDLSRCSWCGRKGTLTDLSIGNRCVIEDECWEIHEAVLASVKEDKCPE